MKKNTIRKIAVTLMLVMMAPLAANAAELDLQLKIDKLTKEVNDLKGEVKKVEDKSLSKWLTIGGDYRLRFDSTNGQTAAYTDPNKMFTSVGSLLQSEAFSLGSGIGSLGMPAGQALAAFMNFGNTMKATNTYAGAKAFMNPATNPLAGALGMLAPYGAVAAYKPNNETIFTNRFGLDLHAKATQDVSVTARLSMYKTAGSENDSQVTGNFFADRVGVFDGTLSHIPSSSLLNVDRAYATWSNIADQPIWFSTGRRPSTDGAPNNLKLNNERPGNGGTPAMLIDYAFDGFAIGYAPDIEALPGAYGKLCGGRGYDSGIETPTNSVKDSDFFGVTLVPIDTDPLRVWLLWDHAFNIFDFPVMQNTAFGNTAPSTNLGDIDWVGGGAMSTLKNVGPGNLNIFADFAMSFTHPNDNVSGQAGFQGLETGAFFAPEAPTDRTGWAVHTGFRYDLPSKTKLGFEFNHGSKNWITFTPASDDMWTSKIGTRGNVFEPYIIQELDLKPISSYLSKTFFRIGYQYYDFEYTGSNNWVGAPVKISSINPSNNMMMLAPVKNAQDFYATFEVKF